MHDGSTVEQRDKLRAKLSLSAESTSASSEPAPSQSASAARGLPTDIFLRRATVHDTVHLRQEAEETVVPAEARKAENELSRQILEEIEHGRIFGEGQTGRILEESQSSQLRRSRGTGCGDEFPEERTEAQSSSESASPASERSENDVDVSKRNDIRDVLSLPAGRRARVRGSRYPTLDRGETVENAQSPGQRRPSALRPPSRKEGTQRRLRMANLSYFRPTNDPSGSNSHVLWPVDRNFGHHVGGSYRRGPRGSSRRFEHRDLAQIKDTFDSGYLPDEYSHSFAVRREHGNVARSVLH